MPQVFAAITAAATAFGATAVGSFLTTTFVGKLLTSVALSALSLALAPKPRAPGIKTSQTQTGGTNPCQFILGRYATAGYAAAPAMSHGKVGKTPNAYLTYVLEVSDAPVTAMDGLIIDGTKVTIGTTPHADYGLPILGDFTDRAWVRFYTGSQTTADPMLLAQYADYPDRPWQTDMIGRGLAYAIVTFRYDREVYDSLPTVRFVVDGLKLYDPRNDSSVGGSGSQRWATPSTWAFTRNPIVMVYNILRGITLPDGNRWGGDCDAEDLPLGNWLAAMNLCDVEVTLAAGGTVPRYTAGFEVSVDDEPAAVIEELLKACHGQLVDMGGIWKVRAGGLGLPVYFLTDEDIIATRPEEFDPFPGLGETFNAISATYPEPISLWESREAPPRYNATWEAEDGNRRLVAALALPAVTHSRQVQHLMQAAIRDHRRMRRHNLTLTPAAAMLEPLDVISWTSARNGYVAKSFEVAEVAEDLRACLPQIAIREVDPTDYDWSPSDELPDAPAPPGVVRPIAQAVPGFSVSGISLTDASGNARRPAIQLIWDGADLDDVEALEWELRRAGTTDLVAQGSTANVEAGRQRVAGGILPATAYQARARLVVRRKRAWTAWISTTTPDTRTGPEDIAQSVYDQMEETARLAGVTPVSELPLTGELNQIVMVIPPGRLYRWDGTAWVTALYAGIEPGSLDIASFASSIRPVEILASLPTTGNTVGRMVFLTTENKLYRWTGSAWTAAVQASDVTGQLVASQIADAAITTAKFAAGIEPVEIVGSLPTTGNFAGRIVFLTSDSKLYRHTGTAWTAAVPAADVTGQLVASQIADAAITTAKFAAGIEPVEIVATLPSTGNFAGRIVFLTSDSKLYRYTGTAWTSAVPAADVTGQLVASQIADAAITTAKFAAGIEPVEIVATLPAAGNFAGRMAFLTTDNKLYRHTGTAWVSTVPAADVTGQLTDAQIAAVAATKLTGQITSTQITDDAITTPKLAAGAVTAAEIAADAVTTAKIAAGAVTASEIAANTITAAQIAAGAITADELTANSVVAGKVAAGAISATEIAAGAITAEKLAVGDFTNFVPNGRNEDFVSDYTAYWTGSLSGGIVSYTSLTATSLRGLQLTKPAANLTVSMNVVSKTYVQIEGGAEYYLEGAFAASNGSTATAGAYVRAIWYDAAKAQISSVDAAANAPIAATFTTYSKIVTAPASARYVRFQLYNHSSQSTVQGLVFDRVLFWRANAGDLVVDGAITASKIAANTITAAQIATGAITADELAANAVVAGKVAAGAISATEIAADAITTAKIAAGAVTVTEIAANTITAGQIAAGAITSSELAANSVIAGKIVAGAISATEIASDAITTAKIAAGAVTASEIAANTITAGQIAAGAITSSELAANSVIAGKIAAGAIAADQIAAGAIVASKLAISDYTNLVPDSELQDVQNWGGVPNDGTGVMQLRTTSPQTWTKTEGDIAYLVARNTGNLDQLASSGFMPVSEGDVLYIAGQMGRNGGTTMNANFHIRTYDKTKAYIGLKNIYAINGTTSTGAVQSGDYTVPSGVFFVKWCARVWASGTDGNVVFASPTVRFKSKGELIVDGAITADKISTGAVTANAIAANAIVASKIAAGEITGTKLAATAIITATAQINNAIITGAKIGDLEVETLNIAGNAVTVPASATASAVVELTTSYQTVLTGTFTRVGARTAITVTAQIDGYGAAAIQLLFRRGSTDLETYNVITGSNGVQSTATIVHVDRNTGTGSTTYNILARYISSGGYTNVGRVLARTMVLEHVKK